MNWIRHIFSRKKADTMDQEEKEIFASETNQETARISADNPITELEEDTLERIKPASSFARQVLALDPREGLVVGILGAWGSGKTSFINLSKGFFKKSDITVLEFNPWMFSGADQLVQFFFMELAAQLKFRPELAQIGELVEEYGDMFSGLSWLPVIGPWIERVHHVGKAVAKNLQRRKKSIKENQNKLCKALKEIDKPIIVILDDIDRLSTSEIRDVFKLVRLTANFPNIIYILAFDRYRVEQALSEQGIPGRDYLEKILQIGIDLPTVPSHILNSQIFTAIDAALVDIENSGHFDSEIWPDVFMEIIQPLIKNMRDVRRYAAAIYGTVRDLGGHVALVDILALEAIRVFLPDVFHSLHASVDSLTATSIEYDDGSESSILKEKIERLISVGKEHKECVRSLIIRLFPAGIRHLDRSIYGSDWKSHWLRERRVAHEDVFRYYLERIVGEQLQSFLDAENAWVRVTDKKAFEGYLQSLPIERIQDVISLFEVYEDEFKAEHVVSATVVLLNLLPLLPDRQRGMFDLNTKFVVGRVVYRLIRALNKPDTIQAAVGEILPQVQSLSSKQLLISIVGYREGAGHKLVSESAAQSFEAEWRAAVRAASVEELANETDLLSTLIIAKREAVEGEAELVVSDTPAVIYALLKGAKSEDRSQTAGNRIVRCKPRLAWAALIELCGSEDTLRAHIENLKASPPDKFEDLMELTDKYLDGWRPQDFDDD